MTHDDGVPGKYDFVAIATSPDGPPTAAGVPARATGLTPRVCTTRRRLTVHVPARRGLRVTQVVAYLGSRRVAASRTRAVRVSLFGLPRGRARLTLNVTGRRDGRTVRFALHRRPRTCGA
jgi:hypothetical protein